MINHRFLIASSALFAGSLLLAQADPKQDLLKATAKLAASDSYSWTSRPKSDPDRGPRRGTVTEGMTARKGSTLITMTRGENTWMAAMKGDKKAMKVDEGWESVGSESSGDERQGRGRFLARMIRNYSLPTQRLQELIEGCSSVSVADGVYTGQLTGSALQERMTWRRRGNQTGPEWSNLKGSIKVWVKDGLVSKYEYHYQGTMKWNDNERQVDRTTVVEIQNVGSTKVELPESAREVLS